MIRRVLQALLFFSAAARAQQTTGSIEGSVISADTNLPLRFAEVRLVAATLNYASKPYLNRVAASLASTAASVWTAYPSGNTLSAH